MTDEERFSPRGPQLPEAPIVTLRYAVPEERRSELVSFLARAVPLYESPGGITVRLYEDRERRGSFLEIVLYATERGFAEDQERVAHHPDWKHTLSEWRAIVGGPIEVGIMDPVRLGPVEESLHDPARTAGAAHAGPSGACGGESLVPAPRALIASLWAARWGEPIVTPFAAYRPDDVQGLCLRDGGTVLALVTWAAIGEEAEIVTLDAFEAGRGYGGRVLDEAERRLAAGGTRLVRLVTSNDNTRAVAFYQRRGYRLVRLHLGALDSVRRAKPGVPLTGIGGVPLRDLWEMEKPL